MSNSYRTLLDGRKVPEYKKIRQLTIESRCPGKWVLVDLETGDIWNHKYKRISRKEAMALCKAIRYSGEITDRDWEVIANE